MGPLPSPLQHLPLHLPQQHPCCRSGLKPSAARRRLGAVAAAQRSSAPADADSLTGLQAEHGARGAEGLDEIGAALRKAAQRRELLAAALSGVGREPVMRLVIDCGLPHAVRSPAEFRSLAKQIQTSVGHNRRSEAPVCLQVTSWGGELAAYAEERMGAAAWPMVKHSQSILELYDPEQIVVLSPDAEAPLTGGLDEARVYVVGGIVDRSVVRGVTSGFASRHSLEVRRLPTQEYADQLGLTGRGVSRRPVLNICDVVLALLRLRTNGGDWVDALDAAIPRRKRTETTQKQGPSARSNRAGATPLAGDE